MIHIEK